MANLRLTHSSVNEYDARACSLLLVHKRRIIVARAIFGRNCI